MQNQLYIDGRFVDALPYLPPSLNQAYGAEIFLDLAVSYRVIDGVKLTVGAENFLDNYPDRNRGPLSAFGSKYPSYRPYEADGGRYYARVSVNF